MLPPTGEAPCHLSPKLGKVQVHLRGESVLGEQDRPGGGGGTLILSQMPYEVQEGRQAGSHTREKLPSTSMKELNKIKLFNLPEYVSSCEK